MSPTSQVTKHSLFNLIGQIIPAFVGIVAIPLLIQNIGMERFGLLTIIWAIIGYFSLFDFGLSRVITYRVSEMHRVQDLSDLPSFFWSSLRLIFIFTLVGSALLAISSKFGFAFSGKISGDLLPEALDCLLVMALALPSITLTAGFKGLLEAEHRFFDLNVLQVIQGTLNFLIPLWISYYRPSLSWIVVALGLLRYLFLILHGWIAIKQQPKLRNVSLLPLKQSVPIIRAGGWYSVSNIVGPFMFYFDRFFLASLFPPGQIAFYTTPLELVNRLLVIPSALSRTLFPTFTRRKIDADYDKIYRKSIGSIALVMVPIAAGISLLAKPGLSIWLGPEFAENSFLILIFLTLGVSVNSVAWIPFTLIQSLGRPDVTAKLHFIELPLYIGMLTTLALRFGLLGAAIAWALRNLVDMIALFYLAKIIRRKI
jgi:O-antigen/teichoic acid export membrane protein